MDSLRLGRESDGAEHTDHATGSQGRVHHANHVKLGGRPTPSRPRSAPRCPPSTESWASHRVATPFVRPPPSGYSQAEATGSLTRHTSAVGSPVTLPRPGRHRCCRLGREFCIREHVESTGKDDHRASVIAGCTVSAQSLATTWTITWTAPPAPARRASVTAPTLSSPTRTSRRVKGVACCCRRSPRTTCGWRSGVNA